MAILEVEMEKTGVEISKVFKQLLGARG